MAKLFMTDREKRAWRLIHESGWSMRRVGRRLKLSHQAISQRVGRVIFRHGGSRAKRQRAPKPRTVRPFSLSTFFEI